jgi:hypothetical protein
MKLGTRHSTSCKHAPHIQHTTQGLKAIYQIDTVELLDRAGLQCLSALQRLKVLHVPCDNPHAIVRLAAQLPRLRSLDLRCCSASGLKASTQDVVLTTVTQLTELRLRLSTAHADVMQRLRMPPHLQVLQLGP